MELKRLCSNGNSQLSFKMSEKLRINGIKKVVFKWLFSIKLQNGRKGDGK